MLWSRSASLMSTTRMSSAIARNIFRMFSACCCSWLWVLNFDSLVTPSTRCAISGPNRSSTSARLYSVSSGTSWSSAARDRDGVDAELREDLGRGDRVRDVRLARGADLRAVRLDGEVEGAVDDREVGLRVVRLRSAARSRARSASRSDAAPRDRGPAAAPSATAGSRPSRRPVRVAAWPRGAPRDRGRRARPWMESTPCRSRARAAGRSAEEADREVAGQRRSPVVA